MEEDFTQWDRLNAAFFSSELVFDSSPLSNNSSGESASYTRRENDDEVSEKPDLTTEVKYVCFGFLTESTSKSFLLAGLDGGDVEESSVTSIF